MTIFIIPAIFVVKLALVLKVVDCTTKLGCAGRALFVVSLPGPHVGDVAYILGDIIKSNM
jgi:hypothetical protein